MSIITDENLIRKITINRLLGRRKRIDLDSTKLKILFESLKSYNTTHDPIRIDAIALKEIFEILFSDIPLPKVETFLESYISENSFRNGSESWSQSTVGILDFIGSYIDSHFPGTFYKKLPRE